MPGGFPSRRGYFQRGSLCPPRAEAPAELKDSMTLTVAIQMDPIERIDIRGDSTFALALEAQARGHRLLYYGPRDLSLREQDVVTQVRTLAVRNERGNH